MHKLRTILLITAFILILICMTALSMYSKQRHPQVTGSWLATTTLVCNQPG
ncbi:hypothetical protein [Fructilactobacillus florum]|uniref:hypothetical protein n=1 Tax=Fructilactobacillus florum TaxID=640331 RepID=UPI0012DEFD9C|nr:hypothetical protein [Fructilactobacillus florum]